MMELSTLEASFHAIAERATGIPASGSSSLPADSVPVALRDAISSTILPRKLTLSAGGAHLSIIARNRRVVEVADIHPADLWPGGKDTTDASEEDFALPFAGCLLAIAAEGDARIDSAMVDGTLPATTLAGYPAARLPGDVETAKAADHVSDTGLLAAILDSCHGHARVWSGTGEGIEIPDGAPVDAAWMENRLEEWSAAGPSTDVQLIVAGGSMPAALALVALDGERCAVACAEPEGIPALERALGTLRNRLAKG